MSSALIVIDVQNDYFAEADGAFPQWQAAETAERIAARIRRAEADGQTVVNVVHLAPQGAPLLVHGTVGAALHPSVAALLADKPTIEKMHADAFLNTPLAALLAERNIRHLELCGIMTQNCVTHTALSPQAAAFEISVLADCCTAPDKLVHLIALNALADRVTVV